MRIGQGTGIEQKIGIQGYSILETERLEKQRHQVVVIGVHPGVDQLPQLVDIGVGGVDQQIRLPRQRF